MHVHGIVSNSGNSEDMNLRDVEEQESDAVVTDLGGVGVPSRGREGGIYTHRNMYLPKLPFCG